MIDKLKDLRKDYAESSIDALTLADDPITQFVEWFKEAQSSNLDEPNAMVLGTVGADNRPSARVVLLKGVDHRGFEFYTNYQSRKSAELEANPGASLVFLWKPLQRQVRIEGKVVRLTEQESDDYFASRPRGSQLGAWASPQSQVISARSELEDLLARVETRFADKEVSRPPHWGGFRVEPKRIEFWQGRVSRLHDRVVYEHDGKAWTSFRLAP